MKYLMIIALLTILIAPSVLAATNSSMLKIVTVDVTVDGKKDSNVGDGDTVTKEAKPESDIKVYIEVGNIFPKASKADIEDIVITGTFSGIDDGDDLEEESTDFSVNAGNDKSKTLEFKVPLKVDEDSYDLEILVEGDDENGTTHSDEITFKIDIAKDRHDLKIYRVDLDKVEIDCKESATLSVTIMNLGTTNEDQTTLEIINADLGTRERITDLELSEDPFDDENEYRHTVRVSAGDATPGQYPISVKVYYDTDKLDDQKTVLLEVTKCQEDEPIKNITQPKETEKTAPPEIVQPAIPVAFATLPPSQPPAEEEFKTGSSNTMALLITANIFAVVLGAIIVALIVRRR
ncbi:MAG: hypothetical protein ABH879_00680 [archaeon]